MGLAANSTGRRNGDLLGEPVGDPAPHRRQRLPVADARRRFYGATAMATRSGGPTSWPDWWDWELEMTPHLEQRMEERDFTEIDVREMLEVATSFVADVVPGRFLIESLRRGRRWQVIVEPDLDETLLVVVTAYPLG
jgi:hypothetical protein